MASVRHHTRGTCEANRGNFVCACNGGHLVAVALEQTAAGPDGGARSTLARGSPLGATRHFPQRALLHVLLRGRQQWRELQNSSRHFIRPADVDAVTSKSPVDRWH